jgi:hypothetical protein
MYLSDRSHILKYGHSLADDRFASINGKPYGIGTSRIISAWLAKKPKTEGLEFDHLSVAIEITLQGILCSHGTLSDGELDAVLRSLPEAMERGPISYGRLASHFGLDDPAAIEDAMETSRRLRWCFDRVG